MLFNIERIEENDDSYIFFTNSTPVTISKAFGTPGEAVWSDQTLIILFNEIDRKDNIAAFSPEGKEIWRLPPGEVSTKEGLKEINYSGLGISKGKIGCSTFWGRTYDIDVTSGKRKFVGVTK